MAEEYIKLHKQVIESDIYQMPPLYLRVFERLLLEANQEDKPIRYKPRGKSGFEEKIIKRGEQKTSMREIAKWVGWHENGQIKEPNPKTIKAILDWLSDQNMIFIYGQGNNLETIYKVLKYDVYQGADSGESNVLETAWNPPKENKKTNPPKSEQEIFDYWNQQKIVIHPKVTNGIRIAVELAAKRYQLESIKTAIDHYVTMYFDDEYEWCTYKWGIEKFLEDPKGITFFMDDGQKWLSYQNRIPKIKPPPEKKNPYAPKCPDWL